ncbi:MAG: hypothetical protein ACI4S3_10365 [Candidatus Gastranaerophilaceae bacterium]
MGINANNTNQAFVATTTVKQPLPPAPEHIKDDTRVIDNNIRNRARRSFQKTTSACTEYPVKGFTGNKKSTFYEFLTMGIVPTFLGSGTLIALFNTFSKFPNFNKKGAKALGNKMALGVVFFGLAKNLSKSLITKPVKWATGIDTEMPYQRVSYTIPTSKNDTPVPEYEQHYVMESRDFPRFDLLYDLGKDKHPERTRNYYYDKIAAKNGLGKNLEASDAEVKPLIRDVISRSNTAKSLSTFAWGAVGVSLAAQPTWNHFFNALSSKSWNKFKPNPNENKVINYVDKFINTAKNLKRITKSFGRNFVKATQELYHGPEIEKGYNKHAGKVMIGIAAALSVLGAINTIYGAKTSGDRKLVIDADKKVTVD